MLKTKLLSSNLLIILCSITNPVLAEDVQGINITDIWVSEAPPTVSILAAYAKIQNKSTETKTISSVSSPLFSKIEIHLSKITDGIATMEKQTSLTIPAESSVELSPGNYHMMLFDPKKPLKAGDNTTITFTFSDGLSKSVLAPVKKRNNDGHDHHHEN